MCIGGFRCLSIGEWECWSHLEHIAHVLFTNSKFLIDLHPFPPVLQSHKAKWWKCNYNPHPLPKKGKNRIYNLLVEDDTKVTSTVVSTSQWKCTLAVDRKSIGIFLLMFDHALPRSQYVLNNTFCFMVTFSINIYTYVCVLIYVYVHIYVYINLATCHIIKFKYDVCMVEKLLCFWDPIFDVCHQLWRIHLVCWVTMWDGFKVFVFCSNNIGLVEEENRENNLLVCLFIYPS